jgi:CheY-like chemotaxis protein
MTEPLALVAYEKLLPGSQLVNRLQDLKYRVEVLTDGARLSECAEQMKPLIVLADLEMAKCDILEAIRRLKKAPGTEHVPVIGFATNSDNSDLFDAAREAGVKLSVTDTALLNHLREILEQALQLD